RMVPPIVHIVLLWIHLKGVICSPGAVHANTMGGSFPIRVYTLKTFHGTFLRHREMSNSNDVELSPKKDECSQWYFGRVYEKVRFTPYCSQDKFLRVNSDGVVDVSAEGPGMAWTPHRNDDQSWSFLSDNKEFLSAFNNISVRTVKHVNVSAHFWLEYTVPILSPALNASVNGYIKTANGTFLQRSFSDAEIGFVDTTPTRTSFGLWTIEEQGDGSVTIRTYRSERARELLDTFDGSAIVANVNPARRTKWMQLKNADGSLSFIGDKGGFLSADINGTVHTVNDCLDSTCNFYLDHATIHREIIATPSYSNLKSIIGNRYIKTTDGNYLRKPPPMADFVVDSGRINKQIHMDSCALWDIQIYFDEVALSPQCARTKDLHSDDSGLVNLNDVWKGDYKMNKYDPITYWIPIKNNDSTWSFIDSHGAFLATGKDGSVFTVPDELEAGHLIIEPLPNPSNPNLPSDLRASREIAGTNCIMLLNTSYISYDHFYQPRVSSECTEDHLWYIENHDGKVALKGHASGEYVLAEDDNIIDLTDKLDENVLLIPVIHGNGWAFQTVYGTWLHAQSNGQLWHEWDTEVIFTLRRWK
ncbi:hypothetical protein PMAYCL1PPCAC_21702, partial [Pristionchus mayeri]